MTDYRLTYFDFDGGRFDAIQRDRPLCGQDGGPGPEREEVCAYNLMPSAAISQRLPGMRSTGIMNR